MLRDTGDGVQATIAVSDASDSSEFASIPVAMPPPDQDFLLSGGPGMRELRSFTDEAWNAVSLTEGLLTSDLYERMFGSLTATQKGRSCGHHSGSR
jgi:hypothetical protein